jgi:glycerol kinase
MAVASNNRLLATVAYQLDGKRTYALEGAIFIAGAGVQWLRDGLKIVKNAAETGALARAADKNQNVYLVPAFVGLGAPYWNADARGVSRRVASGAAAGTGSVRQDMEAREAVQPEDGCGDAGEEISGVERGGSEAAGVNYGVHS